MLREYSRGGKNSINRGWIVEESPRITPKKEVLQKAKPNLDFENFYSFLRSGGIFGVPETWDPHSIDPKKGELGSKWKDKYSGFCTVKIDGDGDFLVLMEQRVGVGKNAIGTVRIHDIVPHGVLHPRSNRRKRTGGRHGWKKRGKKKRSSKKKVGYEFPDRKLIQDDRAKDPRYGFVY